MSDRCGVCGLLYTDFVDAMRCESRHFREAEEAEADYDCD